jgi:putative DNA primase/helicase
MKKKPQEIVSDFCATHSDHLIYAENINSFCLYSDSEGYFKILTAEQFERVVYMHIFETCPETKLSVSMTKDIIGQMKYMSHRRVAEINTPYIALKGGNLINLNTLLYEPVHISKEAFYQMPCSQADIVKTETPRWNQFLDEVIVGVDLSADKSLQNLVQEMFGYYLLNTLEAHKTFFLIGEEGANGKSVMLDVLREMIGKEFVTAMTIETLTANRFSSSNLIGKKLNISSEEESKFVKSDKFKAMVSGDDLTIEWKYGGSITWTPTVKYIFSTNRMPTFADYDNAIVRRLSFIPFRRHFKQEERDTKLISKLLEELPGIIRWALEGTKRLVENRFVFSDSTFSSETLHEFQVKLSAPVSFATENYEEGEGFVGIENMYEEYKEWCSKRGKKQMNFYSFSEDLERFYRQKLFIGLAGGESTKGLKLCLKNKQNLPVNF